MQILLANAKIMFERADRKPLSTPLFQSVANQLAAEMAQMDVDLLTRQLDCSRRLAVVLKTDDIHPPKTGISVHFSCSLP